MGFTKDIKLNNGLSIQDAYHEVDFIAGTKELMNFTIKSYPSKELFSKDKTIEPLTSQQMSFVPNLGSNLNFFDQAVEHLKTLEEYGDIVTI